MRSREVGPLELHKDAYKTIYDKEEDHWWFRGRRLIIEDVLRSLNLPKGARILDVGCGTGGNLVLLRDYGQVDGCDYSEEAIRFCRLRGFVHTFRASADDLPCSDGAYDLVTSFDVIEHLRRDLPAFRELYRVCRSGGHLLVTLPASPRLYSSFDCVAGHLRRYRRRDVLELLELSGFTPLRISNYATLMHPLVLFYSRRGNLVGRAQHTEGMEPIFGPTNSLLNRLFELERLVLRCTDLHLGTSLFALARKPAVGRSL